MSVVTTDPVISNVLTPSQEQAVATSTDNQTLTKDSFLKLLITQMQHQDPFNPLEGIEFTQQLAQFTSLEQLYNLNDGFSSLSSVLTAQNNFKAIDLVGKEVVAEGKVLAVEGGQSTSAEIVLGESAAVTVNVYDEANQLVKKISLGSLPSGRHSFDWDATNNYGDTVDDGVYTFAVSALDAQGSGLEVTTLLSGKVSGVSFTTSGNPTLLVNGLGVGLGEVLEVKSNGSSTNED